jgi:uncharacterized protein (TIGR00375 family)
MKYYVDLHIHSRYSRATSSNLSLPLLASWAQIKGIRVVATGDCLHAGWLDSIQTHLIPDGSGLFMIQNIPEIRSLVPWYTAAFLGEVRFILSTEISSIYKKNGVVRKIHNLVYLPRVEAAWALRRRLERIGNLDADGRPILGLDSRDLLAMVLDIHPEAFLIPAHIWTPWFSLFGSKSGFDSLEECFGDLASHIFALETGLSSDPEMNWLWSALDRFTLVSNSDAHSADKIGREANIFSGNLSFSGLREALAGQNNHTQFLGTLEFFPEEGKYHLDGHRACGVVLTPQETQDVQGICPQCGKPLTLGVLHRVFQLADRQHPKHPPGKPGFTSLIPLHEILGEVLGVGATSKKVQQFYSQLIHTFGAEIPLLLDAPEKDLRMVHPLLGEAIARMRRGEVQRIPGYDGAYGRIHTITPQDRVRFGAPSTLLETVPKRRRKEPLSTLLLPSSPQHSDLNRDQDQAVRDPGPVVVVAGPGTGKTHTLVARVVALVQGGVAPEDILVVTFTRKAAGELIQRLQRHLTSLPQADTLHAVAYRALQRTRPLLSEDDARRLFAQAHPQLTSRQAHEVYARFQRHRETMTPDVAPAYTAIKERMGVWDYTDLLEIWLHELRLGHLRPFAHVLVDEAQDLSPLQWEVVRHLARPHGSGVFLIGDPDQSIYGFRGAAGEMEAIARSLWPEVRVVRLAQSYRSAPEILEVASCFSRFPPLQAVQPGPGEIVIAQFPDAHAEARWVATQVAEMLGGSGHWQMDRQVANLAPSDMAVLVRSHSLMEPLEEALRDAGVPVYRAEGHPLSAHPDVMVLMQGVRVFWGLVEGEVPSGVDAALVAQGPMALAKVLLGARQEISAAVAQLEERFQALGAWEPLVAELELEHANHALYQAAQGVPLVTIHAAKGLEFHTVFIPCVEEGILPWGSSSEEEEMRLLYVAMTRARKRVILSWAASRRMFGALMAGGPSRFLSRLPQERLRLVHEKSRSVPRQLVFR